MVTVKLYGTLRLDLGIKELHLEAENVRSLYPLILERAKTGNPDAKVKMADFNACTAIVNGVRKSRYARLQDGDVVMLLSPVCGG